MRCPLRQDVGAGPQPPWPRMTAGHQLGLNPVLRVCTIPFCVLCRVYFGVYFGVYFSASFGISFSTSFSTYFSIWG